ncbi:hypothetical protein ES319_A08G126000v1 [Gossypium barbadense]|uniref:Uncharacterized protein n=2 Tax=Gossypium TaxID=3633 RepID=A0A5J5URG4_GOSBA|nr:hypothetical protein ES319_A08G126000v1 [Gossypium barbadense]TYH06202.1 hypothetical protein ES288_A08G137700v1 [Gossypium darwinii]
MLFYLLVSCKPHFDLHYPIKATFLRANCQRDFYTAIHTISLTGILEKMIQGLHQEETGGKVLYITNTCLPIRIYTYKGTEEDMGNILMCFKLYI